MNRHLGLFLLTALTTTAAGAGHYSAFLDGFGATHVALSWTQLALGGLWFSVPFLGFLTAHEFGHYGAARWHGLRPSLPYYLPAPIPLTGSLGAVIVFRGQFPNRRVLFDFAAGGPLAGFVVAVIALVLGLAWSPIERLPEHFGDGAAWLGEPLLFQWLSAALNGPVADGFSLNLHPTALAGWLGLLFTMMNLAPISQLDGGHIAYAVVRRHSRWFTIGGLGAIVFFIVAWHAYSWLLWVVLLLVIMRLVGWEHPPSLDDETPLDGTRLLLTALIVAILIVCFIPVPISPMTSGT
jgi:membrane-associated protease RseP (regulator of RpoE activity)